MLRTPCVRVMWNNHGILSRGFGDFAMVPIRKIGLREEDALLKVRGGVSSDVSRLATYGHLCARCGKQLLLVSAIAAFCRDPSCAKTMPQR